MCSAARNVMRPAGVMLAAQVVCAARVKSGTDPITCAIGADITIDG